MRVQIRSITNIVVQTNLNMGRGRWVGEGELSSSSPHIVSQLRMPRPVHVHKRRAKTNASPFLRNNPPVPPFDRSCRGSAHNRVRVAPRSVRVQATQLGGKHIEKTPLGTWGHYTDLTQQPRVDGTHRESRLYLKCLAQRRSPGDNKTTPPVHRGALSRLCASTRVSGMYRPPKSPKYPPDTSFPS